MAKINKRFLNITSKMKQQTKNVARVNQTTSAFYGKQGNVNSISSNSGIVAWNNARAISNSTSHYRVIIKPVKIER